MTGKLSYPRLAPLVTLVRVTGLKHASEAIKHREERQKEAEKVLAWPSSWSVHWYLAGEGEFWVRHCCCVLARWWDKEIKLLFPCYGIFSAISYCIWSSKLTFNHFLCLRSRNSATGQWHLLKPYIQQAILSLCQSTKHEPPPVSFT